MQSQLGRYEFASGSQSTNNPQKPISENHILISEIQKDALSILLEGQLSFSHTYSSSGSMVSYTKSKSLNFGNVLDDLHKAYYCSLILWPTNNSRVKFCITKRASSHPQNNQEYLNTSIFGKLPKPQLVRSYSYQIYYSPPRQILSRLDTLSRCPLYGAYSRSL